MSGKIVTHVGQEFERLAHQEDASMSELEITAEQKASLEDFYRRMPITKAAKVMNLSPKILRGAIERGELAYIWFPGSSRETVTPAMLADWVRDYCVRRKQQIPA